MQICRRRQLERDGDSSGVRTVESARIEHRAQSHASGEAAAAGARGVCAQLPRPLFLSPPLVSLFMSNRRLQQSPAAARALTSSAAAE